MSTDTKYEQEQLLDQQLALSAYLRDLLHVEAPPAASTPRQDIPAAAAVVEPQDSTPVVLDEAPGKEMVSNVPDWAQSRFQALLFEVAGLTLAVPLVKLKGVVPSEEGITPMPGHSPLFLGILPYQGMQSKVVDTARFVLPQDCLAQRGETLFSHLVMIDEGRWALACDSIGKVVDLEQKDVKWRSASGKRPWLAGTVIEKMCALLDVDELTRMLYEGMA